MFRKYFERGLNVVPLYGKKPLSKDWSKWSSELQTDEIIETFENSYSFPYYGIGVICGKASNLIALDIDIDDKNLEKLCPPSPVRKKGKKGETRFFKYNPEIKTAHPSGLDILSDGTQTVLPPSIHPETKKPYEWITKDTLENYSTDDLPILEKKDVDLILKYLSGESSTVELKGTFTHDSGDRCPHGSQARLKALCAALIEQRKSVDECINDLISYDEIHHKPIGYFSDKTRSDFKGDKFTSAVGFYSSILKSINSKREKEGLQPQIPTRSVLVIDINNEKPKEQINLKPFPQADGLIYSIKQSILKISRSNQEELATGGAIAICSALASNRFHIAGRPAITHQYILNVARSGQGKGAGFSIANKILSSMNMEKYNLIGLRNYSSIAAFVNNLPAQRSRLDMIDEFGSILKGFASGSDLKKELEGLLCELYTNQGDRWHGHTTKTDGTKGACIAPAITLYGNIQEETLTSCATKSMIESGLLSRFLYFSANNESGFNEQYQKCFDASVIAKECERIFPFYKMESVLPDGTIITDIGKIEPTREALFWGVGVEAYKLEIDANLYRKENALDKSGDTTGAIFLSRYLQIAERLAIVNAICCDRREIRHSDIEFGMNVIEAAARRSELYLRSIGAESTYDKKMKWFIKYLTKRGTARRSEMLKGSNMDVQNFNKMLETLKQTDQIIEFIDASTGATFFKVT